MKKPDENKLDQLFRNGLTGPEGKPADFREDDWAAMEALLDKKENRKRGLIWLYWVSGSIAALLLLFIGLKWNDLNDAKPNKPLVSTRIGPMPHPETKGQMPKQKNTYQHSDRIQRQPANNVNDITQQLAKNLPGLNHNEYLNPVGTAQTIDSPAISTSVQMPLTATGLKSINTSKLNTPSLVPLSLAKSNNALASPVPDSLAWLNTARNEAEPKVKGRVLLSAALLTAPDLNKAGSGGQGKIGGNAGLQVSAHVSKRWSITTGAAYAIKPYRIGANQSSLLAQYFASANTSVVNGIAVNAVSNTLAASGAGKSQTAFKTLAASKPVTLSAANIPNPLTGVMANCTVLDIPVNINYQVSGNAKRSFSAGAGLSSYFMLTEHYSFSYADNTVRDLRVSNQNQHILGVLNLNTTYQQQVSPNLKLLVQPYLKLPITQIGQEQVNLQSAGIAVGVSWNLSSAKPK